MHLCFEIIATLAPVRPAPRTAGKCEMLPGTEGPRDALQHALSPTFALCENFSFGNCETFATRRMVRTKRAASAGRRALRVKRQRKRDTKIEMKKQNCRQHPAVSLSQNRKTP